MNIVTTFAPFSELKAGPILSMVRFAVTAGRNLICAYVKQTRGDLMANFSTWANVCAGVVLLKYLVISYILIIRYWLHLNTSVS